MVRLQLQISGLEQPLVERVVERLLALEPETAAVLLTGSYAKGTAAVASDLDLMAITPSPRVDYRTWFEEQNTDAWNCRSKRCPRAGPTTPSTG